MSMDYIYLLSLWYRPLRQDIRRPVGDHQCYVSGVGPVAMVDVKHVLPHYPQSLRRVRASSRVGDELDGVKDLRLCYAKI